MKKFLWFLGGGGLFVFPALLFAANVKSLDLIPATLFTYEDRPVTFYARLEPIPAEAINLFLVQWDSEHEKVLYHWKMMDDASFGDVAAGDGLYTRKVEFKDKKEGVRTFSVLEVKDEADISQLKKAKLGPLAFLNVVNRPSFIELMKEIWGKIKGRKER